MKHLFFVAVATGIFSGTSISVEAQTNVNIERYADRTTPKTSLKFIETIEFMPESTSLVLPADGDFVTTAAFKTAAAKKTGGGFHTNIEELSSLQFKYAVLMDREVESISNISLYNFIDDWWGTRYRYGGSDRKGIDCSAFTGKLLLSVYEMQVPRTAKDQYDICEKIKLDDLAEGDLVFFNTRGGVSHVGFYLGDKYFVHSSVHGGVTISSLADDYYSRKFISGGRVIKN